jgi:hypothetical protein
MYFWGVGMPCSYNFVAKLYCIDIRGRLGPSWAVRIRPRLSWAILGHLGPSRLSGAVQAVRGRLGLYGAVRDSLKWFWVVWGHVGPSRAVQAVLGHPESSSSYGAVWGCLEPPWPNRAVRDCLTLYWIIRAVNCQGHSGQSGAVEGRFGRLGLSEASVTNKTVELI